jgi:hypothetical protein
VIISELLIIEEARTWGIDKDISGRTHLIDYVSLTVRVRA